MKFRTALTLSLLSTITFKLAGQPNLDRYVLSPQYNKIIEVPDTHNYLSNPVDLDFHPKRANELWVLNQGTDNTGGNTVIFGDITDSIPASQQVKDGNAWHFMALSSSLAFGSNGNWATAQDIQDANRANGTYTGPTLWSSNLNIYGVVGNPPTSQANGSRIDDVHQSPFGKGIAYETNNVYWVMDGYHGTLKRYNFNKTNTPGTHDPSDAEVFVYSDFSFKKDDDLPAHIDIDTNGVWLYGCDTEQGLIFRIDYTSGSYEKNLTPLHNEPLAANHEYTGHTYQTVSDSALNAPVGIDVDSSRMIVSDYDRNEIILFDISRSKPREMGRISLDSSINISVAGVKIAPNGDIFFVDPDNGKLYKITNDAPTVSITAHKVSLELFPNPSDQSLSISGNLTGWVTYTLVNANGQMVMRSYGNGHRHQLDVSGLSNGFYHLTAQSKSGLTQSKVLIQH